MSRPARWVALATAIAAAVSLAVAVTSPARSGPNCRGSCIGYPYTDAVAFVPRDYLWMYPAMILILTVVALTAAVHGYAPQARKSYSLLALCFATPDGRLATIVFGPAPPLSVSWRLAEPIRKSFPGPPDR